MDNPFVSSAPSNPSMYDVQRKQQLAQMLMQQGMAPDSGTQTAGGYAIRKSPLEGLVKALSMYGGMQKSNEATDMQNQMQESGRQDVSRYVDALRGTPAQPAHELDPDMQGPTAPAQAAVPGDVNKAMAIALQSNNPMVQQAGGALLNGVTSQALPKVPKWVKAEIPDGQGGTKVGFINENSPNPLSTFQVGGTAPAKMEVANGTAYNPYQTPAGQQFAPQANPGNDLVLPGPKGELIPNAPLIAAKKEIAVAGRPSVNQTVQNKMGGSLAEQVGPVVKDSLAKANSAVQQVDAAQRVLSAIDSGKVLAGPGANTRMALMQIGQTLGVGGSDDAEVLANTRQAVRGFAEMTMKGRSQMHGEGQISDRENDMAKKAMSASIDEMTLPELRIVAAASERAARFTYAQHQKQLDNMSKDKNEEVRNLVPYFQASAMPAPMAAPAPAAGGQWGIKPIP